MQETWVRSQGREDLWKRAWQPTPVFLGSPGGSDGKESASMQETWVQSLGWKDPLEEGMATHSSSVQFSSIQSLSRVRLCDPMNHNTPGLPVHHQLPEFTQTHVHWVGDAIQPSHPLLSPSTPAPIPPSIRVFSNESTLRIRWPRYWIFSFSISPSKEHSGLVSFRRDWFDLLAAQRKAMPKNAQTTAQLHSSHMLVK